MCRECNAWAAIARHVWDEVFRLVDIARALQPQLPPEARALIDEVLRSVSMDPRWVRDYIQGLSFACERYLSDASDKTSVAASRRNFLNEAAWRAEALHDNVIRPSLDFIAAMRNFNLDINLSAGLRYFQMIDGVMDGWIVSLRQQQQNWDVMWAEYKQRQAQIDRLNLDALSGTPFIKAYLIS